MAKTPTRVVIDYTDREIKSVTADHPLDVTVVSYDDESLKDEIRDAGNPEELRVIPNDLADPDDGESAGTFDNFDADVNADYVTDVHDYVKDNARVSAYAKTVLALFEQNGGEIEDSDD